MYVQAPYKRQKRTIVYRQDRVADKGDGWVTYLPEVGK